MATDIEKLVVQLSADLKGYQREMQKAGGVSNRQMKAIETRASQLDKRLGVIGKNAASGLIAPLAGVAAALSIREVARYADAWTSAKNSLAVAGVTGQRQTQILDQLYQSAQANAAPVTALADLYGKAAQASDNLGASQDDLIKFSDGVATALRVAGTSAPAASGALQQLGQLLGSARVQAEEFNSVNDGARPILIAVANGLDAAGGSVSRLKELVNDGAVSGRQFFEAFIKGLPTIQGMAANATQTIEQGFTKVDNAFTRYIGSTDASLGATQRLAEGLNLLAANFDTVADTTVTVASVIAGVLVGRSLVKMISGLKDGVTAARALAGALSVLSYVRNVRDLGAAFSLLGVAAGPIGALVGVAAVGAVTYFGSKAVDTAARTLRLKEEMQALGLNADKLGSSVEGASKALDKLAPDQLRQRLADINAELDRMNDRSWGSFLLGLDPETLADVNSSLQKYTAARSSASGVDREAAKQLKVLISQAEAGELSLEQVQARLAEIGKVDVSEGMGKLIDKLREVFPLMRALREYQAKTLSQLDGSISNRTITPAADYQDRLAQAETTRREGVGKTLLDEEKRRAALTDSQRDLEDEMKRLREAIEKQGGIATDAAVRAQAEANLASKAASSGGGSLDLHRFLAGGKDASHISGLSSTFEGKLESLFAALPKELAGQLKINSGYRSVERQQQLWQDALKKYGSVAEARRWVAPPGNSQHNKGNAADLGYSSDAARQWAHSNASRFGLSFPLSNENWHIEDADARAGVVADKTKQLEEQGQAYDDVIARAREFVAEQGLEGTALGMTTQAANRLRYEQELLNQAKQAGLELSPAQIDSIKQLAGEMAIAEEKTRLLTQSQDDMRRAAEEWASVGKDVTKGFITDLMNGATAADALKNALSRVADVLLDQVLDAIFQVNGAGSGGGGLGGLGGIISSIFGGGKSSSFPAAPGGSLWSDGGYTGPGGKYQPAGVVHKGEVVWSKRDVSKAGGVAAVEAMRLGQRGYDGGGPVALRAPTMPVIRNGGRGGNFNVRSQVDVSVSDQGELRAFVKKTSVETVDARTPRHVDAFSRNALPQRMAEINSNPRKRG
ncbi:D-alanyl-D-alanine carboxypeptidase family protein [Rhizobium sp. CFBP 8752]|uniref:tape measure protein n=1 Tax=Rhizobium sp. CFBP 8752 TaxID=2775301 RepID=UPI00177B7C59|nr:tape measure protein [Rhizobium sp. CFBP 8752]MBD8665296.1 D-alanyl-D-alanine carboxypeptidase family protein [Rhizobium sp. CFBP 8752]